MDGIHTKSGIPFQRWRMGYALKLFGPEVTAALANAGYFRVAVDEPAESR